MFCKHDYIILDKTILASPYEQMQSVKRIRGSGDVGGLFRKKLIIVMKCSKCRKTKKIVEVNP